MDVIRRQLGEDKINYFAWSYGSYLGSVYATLFPNNTDRVVIDSVVDPNWVWREQFRSWGSGGAIRWPDFANWAAANDATYHFGDTPDKVTALYYQLYAEANADPRPYPDVFSDGTLVNGPHNILMLQNLRDPNTPYVGAREMRSALGQRAVMVSVDEGGHAIFGFETNSCVNAAAVAYLGNGKLPADDTSCAAEVSAATQFAITPERLRTLKQAARELSGLPRGH